MMMITDIDNDNDNDGDTVIDDGLSSCSDDEEASNLRRQIITTSQANRRRYETRSYKLFTLCLLSTSFIISVIVTTIQYYYGTVTSSGSSNSYANDEGLLDLINDILHAQSKENDRRLQQTLDYLIKYDISSPETLDITKTLIHGGTNFSPQYQAALWISKDDRMRIKIPSSITNTNDYGGAYPFPFIQRYTLAVLFFATGGDTHWYHTMNFLSDRPECAWFDQFLIDGLSLETNKFVFGVLCDGQPDWDDDDDDMKENDVWGGQRMVTGISLPREFRLLLFSFCVSYAYELAPKMYVCLIVVHVLINPMPFFCSHSPFQSV